MRISDTPQKRLIKHFLLFLSILAFIPQRAFPDSAAPEPKTIDQLITDTSAKYGVPAKLVSYIIDHENPRRDPDLQSGLRYSFSDPKRGIVKGDRERSFGLAQIHLPDHPDISYASSTDPIFSIDYIGRELSKGHCKIWTTCPL